VSNKPIKRLLGAFPVFANEAEVNHLHTLAGKPYDQSDWDNVAQDTLTFEAGFKHRIGKPEACFKSSEDVTPEKLNAMFNFVTNSIGYLYQQGVPEWTMNFDYPKGAVVTYKDKLLISTVDGNKRHPANTMFWKSVEPTETNTTVVVDTNPIGTIITVPHSVDKSGYIPFIEGTKFNKTEYPDLYNALGSDTFGSIHTSIENELPLGTLVHTLDTTNVPNGWMVWEHRAGNLINYPELKHILTLLVQRLPMGTSKLVWQNALNLDTLPQFDGDFFLRSASYGFVGDYVQDSIKSNGFNMMPVIVDESTTLNPMGIMRCGDDTRIHSPISGVQVTPTLIDTKVVLTGNYVDKYQDIPSAKLFNVGSGLGNTETAPKHLKTRLLIKASKANSLMPSTHKQLIKAFEV